MREYRGKSIDDKTFVYGSLLEKDGKSFIVNDFDTLSDGENTDLYAIEWYEVDPETVGQYTGKKDEGKTEIFDGDHLYAPGNLDDELQYVGTVEWDDDDHRWEVASFYGRFEYIPSGCFVRGNRWDLLGEVRE